MKEEIQKIEGNSRPAWGAVYAVSLGVSGLIVSEFLPVSLLTPMARDLQITAGVAGQAISVTAIVALLAALFIAVITQKLDRKYVMWAFCLLQVASNLLVAFAPNFSLLLVGRVLLGIGIGGFWSMAAATAMRLVPKEIVPKALSVIFGSVSVATVVAAPLGSFLGAHFGWRYVFLLSAALGVLALVWQLITLPSMPTDKSAKLRTLLDLLKRPSIKSGMFATMLAFMAYATFITYLRPFLENIAGVNANILSAILLGFGLANFIGSTLAGYALQWNLQRSLVIAPASLCVIVAALILLGGHMFIASALIAIWGLIYGVIQVGWTAWLTQTVPDEAESAGGIQVAVIQLAIFIGAAMGGILFDHEGTTGVFSFSSLVALTAAIVAFISFRRGKSRNKQLTQTL
jgi:predicted MFS family arabinose efflux permease